MLFSQILQSASVKNRGECPHSPQRLTTDVRDGPASLHLLYHTVPKGWIHWTRWEKQHHTMSTGYLKITWLQLNSPRRTKHCAESYFPTIWHIYISQHLSCLALTDTSTERDLQKVLQQLEPQISFLEELTKMGGAMRTVLTKILTNQQTFKDLSMGKYVCFHLLIVPLSDVLFWPEGRETIKRWHDTNQYCQTIIIQCSTHANECLLV